MELCWSPVGEVLPEAAHETPAFLPGFPVPSLHEPPTERKIPCHSPPPPAFFPLLTTVMTSARSARICRLSSYCTRSLRARISCPTTFPCPCRVTTTAPTFG